MAPLKILLTLQDSGDFISGTTTTKVRTMCKIEHYEKYGWTCTLEHPRPASFTRFLQRQVPLEEFIRWGQSENPFSDKWIPLSFFPRVIKVNFAPLVLPALCAKEEDGFKIQIDETKPAITIWETLECVGIYGLGHTTLPFVKSCRLVYSLAQLYQVIGESAKRRKIDEAIADVLQIGDC